MDSENSLVLTSLVTNDSGCTSVPAKRALVGARPRSRVSSFIFRLERKESTDDNISLPPPLAARAYKTLSRVSRITSHYITSFSKQVSRGGREPADGAVERSLLGGEEDEKGDELAAEGRVEQQARGLWLQGTAMLFNPNNKYVWLWWQLSVLLTYWNLFQVPFSVAYYDSRPAVMNAMVWAVDFFFLADVLLSFCTPVFVHGQMVTNRKEIALRYLSFHFWIDLSAAVPFDRLRELAYPGSPYASLAAFTRVLRVRRLFMLQAKLEKKISMNYDMVILGKLLTMAAVIMHTEACLFWFVGAVQAPHGWVHEFGIIDNMAGQPWRQYLVSLYWAVTTFTTVGYGDIHPVNEAEQTFTLLVMIINMGMGAYVIANLTMLTTKADNDVLRYRAIVDEVMEYMQTKNVPDELKHLAIQHLETNQDLASQTDRALVHCPAYIRNRILIHLYRRSIRRAVLLKGCSEDFINSICHTATMSFFQANTVVTSAGERSYNWHIVISGSLVIRDREGNVVRAINQGCSFGDKGILATVPQKYDVSTTSLCRLLVVPHAEFKAVCLQHMPDYRRACINLIGKLQKIVPVHEKDRRYHETVIATVNSHILSLKTDMVSKLCAKAAAGDIPALKSLLESDPGHDINEGDYEGKRPIHLSGSAGQTAMVQHLVEVERADVNVKDNLGSTPLQDAVKHKMPAAARALRAYGARLDSTGSSTLLCRLVMERQLEHLELYLENGADPNAQDYDARTPLHIACAERLLTMAQLLIWFGANLHLSDRAGLTPMDEAKKVAAKTGDNSFVETLNATSRASHPHQPFQPLHDMTEGKKTPEQLETLVCGDQEARPIGDDIAESNFSLPGAPDEDAQAALRTSDEGAS